MTRGSVVWLAGHELRLAWRDALAMARGGRKRSGLFVFVAAAVFALVLHVIAYACLAPLIPALAHPDKALLVLLTGSAALAWLLVLSQALESVTRAFYARADLDLVLSSPIPARRVFSVRLLAIALGMVAMTLFLVGPAVDVMALCGGLRFLAGFGVVVAMALSATAAAAVLATLLFRVFGPARTRLASQIVAAVLGAGFVIAIQICAIATYGTLSRLSMLRSPVWVAAAPDLGNPFWWPARAALGETAPLAALLVASLATLALAVGVTATALAAGAARVQGVEGARTAKAARRGFRPRSPAATLRHKEWMLLWRDPWLVSQSLMQLLYLIPPAVLLWRDYHASIEGLLVLVPVLVMAAGQLAGGLAWLAVSGEDAPDLILSAPVSAAAVLRAKIEAVAIAVAAPILPIAIALSVVEPRIGAVTAVGAALATAAACANQYFFRAQAKRSNFRRRQTSSRVATFAEAFLSISLAATAAFAAAGSWLIAGGLLLLAVAILAGICIATRRAATVALTAW